MIKIPHDDLSRLTKNEFNASTIVFMNVSLNADVTKTSRLGRTLTLETVTCIDKKSYNVILFFFKVTRNC